MHSLRAFASLVALSSVFACGAETTERTGSSRAAVDGVRGVVSGTGGIGLRVRERPNTSSRSLRALPDGAEVAISCQTEGEEIDGNAVWDFVPEHGGYMSDRYVLTGTDGFIDGVPRCGDEPVDGAKETGKTTVPPPEGADVATIRRRAIDIARSKLGVRGNDAKCNAFSTLMGRGCEEWCSDFLNWVWREAGADVEGITAYSGTFNSYGQKHGTWKPGADAQGVQPGDAVTWGDGSYSAHVGMVTEVHADGSLRVINGNFENQVQELDMARSSTAGTGYPIFGFASPVPRAP